MRILAILIGTAMFLTSIYLPFFIFFEWLGGWKCIQVWYTIPTTIVVSMFGLYGMAISVAVIHGLTVPKRNDNG